jgi:two-component system sensor histidine kinase KdpD
VVKQADEVVMVDATTGALLNRLKRGDIYHPEKAQAAMEHFFKESTLAALRELALRETARELELREEESAQQGEVSPSDQQFEKAEPSVAPLARDRILIHITPDPSTAMVIRRGRRIADFLGAECLAVFVSSGPDLNGLPKEEREAVEKHLSFAQHLQIETRVIEGHDAADALVDFARRNQITQLLLARPRSSWLSYFPLTNFAGKLIRKAKDMRIVIIADRQRQQDS